MNCRRINSLLSAYIDKELTGEEMMAVRSHLYYCEGCQAEYEALVQTKRIISALGNKIPRPELEGILLSGIEREAGNPLRRWLPDMTPPAFLYQVLDSWETAIARLSEVQLRPNTVVATAVLSVAGIWMASTALDQGEETPMYVPAGAVFEARPLTASAISPMSSRVGLSSATNGLPGGYGIDSPVSPTVYRTVAAEIPMVSTMDGDVNGATTVVPAGLVREHSSHNHPLQNTLRGSFSVIVSMGSVPTGDRYRGFSGGFYVQR